MHKYTFAQHYNKTKGHDILTELKIRTGGNKSLRAQIPAFFNIFVERSRGENTASDHLVEGFCTKEKSQENILRQLRTTVEFGKDFAQSNTRQVQNVNS